LTAKYEPDTLKTDRDNDVKKWCFQFLMKSAHFVTSPWAAEESYSLPVFCFRLTYIARIIGDITWKRQLAVW